MSDALATLHSDLNYLLGRLVFSKEASEQGGLPSAPAFAEAEQLILKLTPVVDQLSPYAEPPVREESVNFEELNQLKEQAQESFAALQAEQLRWMESREEELAAAVADLLADPSVNEEIKSRAEDLLQDMRQYKEHHFVQMFAIRSSALEYHFSDPAQDW